MPSMRTMTAKGTGMTWRGQGQDWQVGWRGRGRRPGTAGAGSTRPGRRSKTEHAPGQGGGVAGEGKRPRDVEVSWVVSKSVLSFHLVATY